MRAHLYYWVRKLFGQEFRNELKLYNYKLQKTLSPYYKRWYGSFTAEDLYNQLRAKLPQDYEVLMVHSSHSGMLPMYQGNFSDLLSILLELVGKDKTLVMPAFFFGERKYNYDVVKYYSNKPYMDIRKMPSQMGMITEMFRKLPNVKNSMHPTHRISALGPLADYLTQDHQLCQTGCGVGSPFDKMTKVNTSILGIGVTYYRSMTQTHAVEDILFESGEYPTKFDSVKIPVTLLDADKRIDHLLTILDKSPYERRVHPLLSNLMKEDLVQWKFHGVPIYFANAQLVTQKLKRAALSGISAYS